MKYRVFYSIRASAEIEADNYAEAKVKAEECNISDLDHLLLEDITVMGVDQVD